MTEEKKTFEVVHSELKLVQTQYLDFEKQAALLIEAKNSGDHAKTEKLDKIIYEEEKLLKKELSHIT